MCAGGWGGGFSVLVPLPPPRSPARDACRRVGCAFPTERARRRLARLGTLDEELTFLCSLAWCAAVWRQLLFSPRRWCADHRVRGASRCHGHALRGDPLVCWRRRTVHVPFGGESRVLTAGLCHPLLPWQSTAVSHVKVRPCVGAAVFRPVRSERRCTGGVSSPVWRRVLSLQFCAL